MTKIIFLEDYQVQDKIGTTYKKGQTLECEQASANHFISRGVARDAAQVQRKAVETQQSTNGGADVGGNEKTKSKPAATAAK